MAALAIATGLRRAMRDVLAAPSLQRVNYAGRSVTTGGGAVAVAATTLVLSAVALSDAFEARRVVPTIVAVLGFGALGFFDDVVGTHAARGLRGHLAAARRGQLTSGALKLGLGVAVAVLVVVPYVHDWSIAVPAVVVIAGAANIGNLFDLAPGRASKVAVVALVGLLIVGGVDGYVGPMVMVAATLALAPAEMREELMLGDAGANPLGAAVGLAVVRVTAASTTALWAAAAAVLAVNIAGELVSFGRVIDRVAPLRALDRLGRRR